MKKIFAGCLSVLMLTLTVGCQNKPPLSDDTHSSQALSDILNQDDASNLFDSASFLHSQTEESSVVESSVTESSVTESSVTESSVMESSVMESSVTESSVQESSVMESSVTESSVMESSVMESSVTESSVQESSYTAPVSQAEPQPKPNEPIVNAYQPYTAARLQRDIDALCRRYPDLITQFPIGLSTQGRVITCVTLGSGSKKGCIVSGIHSREHITISFSMRCLEEFAQAYQKNEWYGEYNLRQLLNEYTLYFVPMCNPDGTEVSTNGAKPLVYGSSFSPDDYKLNANGVNLNRNFPYNWENQYTHQTMVPGDEKYAGPYAASEKETQALMALCADEGFSWLLDMHIVGNGMYWRDELNGEIPGDSRMREAITERCGYRYFGVSDDITTYSGGLENWFRSVYGKPSFCIEMVPYEQSGRVGTYIGLNSIFEDAVNWRQTKYTYLAAMVSG